MTETKKDTTRRKFSKMLSSNPEATKVKETSILNDKPKDKIVCRWSCDICGGNDDSGCLYYDPSECPKRN